MATTCTTPWASRRAPRPTRSRRPTASSPASTIPTRAATRRASRRSRAPTTCSPIRRSARRTTRGARRTAGGGAAGPQFQDFEFGDLGDLFGGLFGGGGRGRRAAGARQPERGADVEAHVSLSFEDSLAGAEVRVPVELETACHTCARLGRRARDGADRLPPVRRPRRHRRLARALRALAAVPALPWQRHDRRASVPDVPRHRPRAHDQALHGEDPRRRQGRHAHPAQGAWARRAGTAAPRATSGSSPASTPSDALRAPRRRPDRRRAGHATRRPRSAPRSRCRRPKGRSR